MSAVATALMPGMTGALAEVLEGLAAVLQVGELGRREAQLLGQLQRLGADLPETLPERGLHRHARLHADQQHVERVGEGGLDRGLAPLHQVLDEHVRHVEAEIAGTHAQIDT